MPKTLVFRGRDEDIVRIPVQSAILEDIQRRVQVQADTCGCDDYENCEYENKE